MTSSFTLLNHLAESWSARMGQASWQGGVALLLVLLLCRMLPRIPGQIQCWLWRLACLKLLVAGLWTAPIELPWLPPPTAPAVTATVTHATPTLLVVSVEDASTPNEIRAATPAAVPRLSGLSWLMLAWGLGVCVKLAHLWRRWWDVRRTTVRLPLVTDAALQQVVRDRGRELGLRRVPELRCIDLSVSPYLVGIVRPVIVLPASVCKTCSDAERETAILHELAHGRRRDLLWNWLPALAQALFWFHPLVWWSHREWRLSQEIAADQLAMSLTRVDVSGYAAALVELIARCPATRLSPLFAVSLSPAYSQLRRRIMAMQTIPRFSPTARLPLMVALFILAAPTIVPWTLVAREIPAVPSPPAAHVAGPTQTIIADSVAQANAIAQADEAAPQTPAVAQPERDDETAVGQPTVGGIVRDENGQPVEGATVVVGHFAEAYRDKTQTLHTDSEGRFRTHFPDSGLLTAAAWKQGLSLAGLFNSGEVERMELAMTLKTPAPFVGRVENELGDPIPGAHVRVEVFTTDKDLKGWNHLIMHFLEGTELDRHVTTTTDEQGLFRLSSIPAGASAMLRVSAPKKGMVRTAMHRKREEQFLRGTEESPAVIPLAPEGIVEGRVVTDLDDVSVAGLTVNLQASNNSPVIAEQNPVQTDAEGRFIFKGLREGTANIMLVDHEPDGPWTYKAAADVAITPGQRAFIVIELIRNFIVEGRVVDGQGKPVEDMYVGLYGTIRPKSGAAIIGYRTKEDGHYRFHLPPGSYYMYNAGGGSGDVRYGHTSGAIDVPEGEGRIVGPTLVLKPRPERNN